MQQTTAIHLCKEETDFEKLVELSLECCLAHVMLFFFQIVLCVCVCVCVCVCLCCHGFNSLHCHICSLINVINIQSSQ